MQLSFTSSPAEPMYFKEVVMDIYSDVKFEFFENGKLVAKLIDGDFQAIAIWKNTIEYFSKRDPLHQEPPYNFKLTNKEKIPFVWGEVDHNTVIFPGLHSSYIMTPRTHFLSKEKFRKSYEFVMHKKVCCVVKYGAVPKDEGWFKRNFGTGDTTGIIEMKDNLGIGHLFAFMLMVSRFWSWPAPPIDSKRQQEFMWD